MRSIRILALMKVSFLPLDLLKYIYIYIYISFGCGEKRTKPKYIFSCIKCKLHLYHLHLTTIYFSSITLFLLNRVF